MASMKKIMLKGSDGEAFEVEEVVAIKSQMIKHMVEDGCAKSEIPLPNVTSRILAKVIEYCQKHVGVDNTEEKPSDDDLKSWDTNFVKVDLSTLFDLLLAANYLEIEGLLELTSQAITDMIKEKTPEEIRKIFKIKNDFTPKEEQDLYEKNKWAFD